MKTPIVSLFLLATLSISCGEKPATPTLESSGSNLSSDIGDAPQVLPVNGGNSANAGYSGGGQPMQANMPMQEAPAYGQPAPAYGQPAPAYGQPAPAQGFLKWWLNLPEGIVILLWVVVTATEPWVAVSAVEDL